MSTGQRREEMDSQKKKIKKNEKKRKRMHDGVLWPHCPPEEQRKHDLQREKKCTTDRTECRSQITAVRTYVSDTANPACV